MFDKNGKTIKAGDQVWIDYTPAAGHGDPIRNIGLVTSVGETLHKNTRGTSYYWVSVKVQGGTSVFPSWCLTSQTS